jgi:hypothetical protein
MKNSASHTVDSKACPRCGSPLDCKVAQRSVLAPTFILRLDALMKIVSVVEYSCRKCGYCKPE